MITLKKIFKIRKNLTQKEKEKIKQAYLFAKKAHAHQELGGNHTPFILHPLFATYLLAKWRQDADTICAGLLHDVIEDCEVSLETIRLKFGEKVAFYVDGMSWFRSWDQKEQRYVKDWPGYHKKFCNYSLVDPILVIIKAADEMSKQKPPKDPTHLIKSSGPRAKTFWIPFFRSVGLPKVSELIESKVDLFLKKKYRSGLKKYITKKDLNKIRSKSKKMKGVDELR